MAGYRPKSLDELNNLYGKAISAENEIKKGSSLLKTEVLDEELNFTREKTSETVHRPVHPKEISGDVDDFIRQFSNEGFSPSRSASSFDAPRKRPAALSDLQPKAPEKPQEKPVHRMDPQKEENLSGLMNDYAKIMNDNYDDEEDEDETFSSRKNLFKSRRNERNERKGKKKASKDIISDNVLPQETEAPIAAAKAFEPISEPVPVVKHEPAFGRKTQETKEPEAFVPETHFEPSIPAEKAEEKEEATASSLQPNLIEETEKPSSPLFTDMPEKAVPVLEKEENISEPALPSDDYDDDSYGEPFERTDNEDDFEFGVIEPPKRSAGATFAKILLSILLVLTLLSTVLTGVCVFTVNSERSLAGYMFFSATNSYEDAGVKGNDFIICKKEASIEDGEKVIFINRDLRSFSFGVKTAEKTDVSGNEYYTVSSAAVQKSDVLGVIVKTVPSFGKFIRAIVDNFLFILLGLVALALILTLTLCLAFRGKRRVAEYEDYDEEYPDENEYSESDETADSKGTASDDVQPEADGENPDEDFDNGNLFDGIE